MRRSLISHPGRRFRLWPTIDYHAELRPSSDEEHPIDALLDDSTVVQRAYRRVLDLEPALSRAAGRPFREYADARLHLQSVREELAFNVGVEVGTTAARAESMAGTVAGSPGAFRAATRRLLQDQEFRADERLIAAIEIAWALARGPVARDAIAGVLRRPKGRPRRARHR